MESMQLSNSFMVGIGIQRSILNMFGEATAVGTDWDLNEFVKRIKDDPGVKKEFDIYKLSDGELLGLGFGKISDDCNIRLIPSWLYSFLPDQLFVYGKDTPDGIVIKKNQLGVPRMGYFGLGILAKGMPISNSTQEAVLPSTSPEDEVKVN